MTNMAFSQNNNTVGKIALSIIMPDNLEGLSVGNLSKLETKITQILTATGLSATGYNNNFVIYPKFTIYDASVVESGMQDITVINCELSLFIKQVDNNVVFATISKQLKGNGKDKQISITNAISKINSKDQDYQIFIDNGKNKITTYYESKCGDIISNSESLVKMQEYEQALGLLMTVPEEVSCFSKVQQKSIEVYKAYQNQTCKVQLQEAKTQMASNDYNSALTTLSQIDPSTPCYKESQILVNNAAAKIDIAEKKEWDLKVKSYNDDVALEKQRINAVRDIAVAYYKRKPTTVNYTYLIR
ncbi:hypothetical protein CLU82_0560 [Flavobacterium sp. 5]|nr:hypothetical protein CLU82_0560 [Flavobacterium sp. 5]